MEVRPVVDALHVPDLQGVFPESLIRKQENRFDGRNISRQHFGARHTNPLKLFFHWKAGEIR